MAAYTGQVPMPALRYSDSSVHQGHKGPDRGMLVGISERKKQQYIWYAHAQNCQIYMTTREKMYRSNTLEIQSWGFGKCAGFDYLGKSL